MKLGIWGILLAAALLEVGGDAVIRTGLRGAGPSRVVLGIAMVGLYGLVVNLVPWDFSKLFGVYVAVFALISVLFGVFVFREKQPVATWIGLGLILVGGLVIQLGARDQGVEIVHGVSPAPPSSLH